MTRRTAALALVLLAACGREATGPSVRLSRPSLSTADVTPPTVTAISISPTSINTTLSSATVTVNYTITDDVGVTDVSAGFDAVSSPQFRSGGDGVAVPEPTHSGSFTITFPRYVDDGIWQLVLNIGDAAGNYHYYTPADLAAAGFPTDVDVTSDEDLTAPTLAGVSFSPTTVNTTTGDNVITVNYTVTDDKSGTVDVSTGFAGPNPPSHASGGSNPGSCTNCSGSLTITIPQNSELGTWHLVMNIGDAVGNYRYYTSADIATAGFPTDLQVVDADHVAPTLSAVSFSPTSINTSLGPASVTVSYTVTDDLSGTRDVAGGFGAPSSNQGHGGNQAPPDALSYSGSFVVNFPRYSDAGTWKLAMNIGDAAGNYRYYTAAALAAAGFPTDLDVVSDEDITPPTLTAVSFTPTIVNTPAGATVVTVNYSVTDNKVGTVDVSTGFGGPSPSSFASGYGHPGGSTNFTGSLTITIPQNSELGTWKLVMNIGDAVGNYRYYTSADLAAAGFPTDLRVVSPTPVVVDIRHGDMNPWTCTNDKGDFPVAILSSATFNATTVDGSTLRFGKTGTEAAAARQKNGALQLQTKDVDRDGRLDVVYQFIFGQTGFTCADIPAGQTTATVTAKLTGAAAALPIAGSGPLQLKKK